MTLSMRRVSVATSGQTELTDGTGATLRQAYALTVLNADAANPIYLGDNTVTSTTGYQLAAGAQLQVDLNYGERLYAQATGSAVTAHVLQSKF